MLHRGDTHGTRSCQPHVGLGSKDINFRKITTPNPATHTQYSLTGMSVRLGLGPLQFLSLVYKVRYGTCSYGNRKAKQNILNLSLQEETS